MVTEATQPSCLSQSATNPAVAAGKLLQADVGSPVMFSLPASAGAKAKDESFLEVSSCLTNLCQRYVSKPAALASSLGMQMGATSMAYALSMHLH